MYVVIYYTSDDWIIQKKQEDGTDIGGAATFNNTDYRLERDEIMQAYVIYDAKREDKAFPPVVSYPASRTIIEPD